LKFLKITKIDIMDNIKYEVPVAKNPESMTDQFTALYDVIKILRIACPWDSVQSNKSIAHLMIEEAYETIDAIQKNDDKEFCKELGDLLLHIIMHAIMAEERGAFNMNDVMIKIQEKLVFRHPHVFGDVQAETESQVLDNWEALKQKEGKKSALDGVPNNLPALLQAERIQHKAARVGFDWDDRKDIWNKVEEEFAELKHEIFTSKDKEKSRQEFGDFLFSLVNAGRFEEIVAEEALQITNTKFKNRFKYIEKKAAEQGKILKEMTLAEMDVFWDEAKTLE
jgi:XTP/dITP diphosphohydrolase